MEEKSSKRLFEQGYGPNQVGRGRSARERRPEGDKPGGDPYKFLPTCRMSWPLAIDRSSQRRKPCFHTCRLWGRGVPGGANPAKVIPQAEGPTYYRLLASLQHKEFSTKSPAFPRWKYIFKGMRSPKKVAYNSVIQKRTESVA